MYEDRIPISFLHFIAVVENFEAKFQFYSQIGHKDGTSIQVAEMINLSSCLTVGLNLDKCFCII